ncbi:MAG: ral nucleoside transport system permease protein [Thermomicrobiales bacterium]|jgi:simple sugar transport system permease protein|nr:ral nucleoside transport system permease protein [Thermomicrobiales bacterium]
MNGIDLSDFIAAMLATGLLRAVPLVLAGLGEAVAERAGLLNLGIEGMMLSGCFFGFWAAYHTESLTVGMLAAVAAGLVLGLIFGFLTISLRVDQVLVGLAITIFSAGLTGFLFRDLFGGQNVSAAVDPIQVAIPVLRDIPIIGEPFFDRQLIFYLGWGLVPVFAWLLVRTRFGLNVRAVGEHPFAADAAGVNVIRTRYLAIAIGGAMAGFAGGYLAVADLKIFTIGMTVGQGFIALAITMLGRWNPYRIVVGAILFGMLRALADGLPILGVDVRTEFIGMLPYIGIMLGLVVLAGRTALPSALGVPYARGQR